MEPVQIKSHYFNSDKPFTTSLDEPIENSYSTDHRTENYDSNISGQYFVSEAEENESNTYEDYYDHT